MKTNEKIMYGFYEDTIMICDMCGKKYVFTSNSRIESALRKYINPQHYDLCPQCFISIEKKILKVK